MEVDGVYVPEGGVRIKTKTPLHARPKAGPSQKIQKPKLKMKKSKTTKPDDPAKHFINGIRIVSKVFNSMGHI